MDIKKLKKQKIQADQTNLKIHNLIETWVIKLISRPIYSPESPLPDKL